ncbi:MAG: ATP-dependent RNA helicase HrpA [Nevskiaceae bacterium]|nr:MAG: ATP-dependent RNA helicase HrpA [Nevskiaceae bacterium]
MLCAPCPAPVPLNLPVSQFAEVRDRLLARDAARLARTLDQAKPGRFDLPRFEHDLQRARLAAENRARLRPARIAYPEELPVVQAREELLAAIRDHQVVVVCGETGSGKTTQLPKLCLELGRGMRGLIGHTQPRRLAARSVAARIARELDTSIGDLVGYETRFDRRVSERSLVKLMTDGILLAELQRDRELLAYDTIIIDEAHERSLNIDFLLGWLKRLLPRRPDLKIIVTSATLDPERLSKHFDGAPILTVSGRTYPVELRYREPDKDDDLEDRVASAIAELWPRAPQGDVLVFLPGEREIHDLARSLPGRFPRAEVLPLYSRLPAAQQDRVFSSGGAPRIVLSTNVAETSLTVPGIRYVVDAGTARINRWSPRLGVQQLQIEAVAQSAANQRAGRCGRVGPGICIRLYGEDDFAARAPFTDPEILRANLAGVILQMTALRLGEIEEFPWIDPPEQRHVSEGYRLLQTLGALDEQRALTPLGRELARLPLDPRIARIALAGRDHRDCREHIWALAAALSVQDPHEVPPEAQEAARSKHAAWRHARSDFLSLLQLWQRWREWSESSSNRQLRRLCKENFVSYLRMEEWEAVYRQIVDLLRHDQPEEPRASKLTLDELSPQIHKGLLAGLIDHIGLKAPEKPEYQGPRGRKFKIFPGSALAKKPPQWLMSAQLAQTSQLFARVNAAVEPEWLAEVGAHLVKRTLTHPQWNGERGEVTATEHQSLFGLPLVKRQRHYGSLQPAEARRIFILDGLVRGDGPNKLDFLQRNLRLIEEVREKEARLRRPDLLADEEQLAAFYEARLPADVCTVAGLKAWLRRLASTQPAPSRPGEGARRFGEILLMREEDVLRPGANADVATQFPDHVDIGGHAVKLSYAHDPGADADGVSFHIPLALLHGLPAEPFDWLVPGLRTARIEALIRTLPQQQRRYCTPAAEYATALAARMSPADGDFLEAICRHFHAMTGVKLLPADFAPDKLPAHLRPRLVVEDASGRAVVEGESLPQLQQRSAGPARAALRQAAARDEAAARWVRDGIEHWDFGDLPDAVTLAGGAQGYPALQLQEGGGMALRLLESPDAAAAVHAAGVRALLLAKLPDRLRDLAKTARTRLHLAVVGAAETPEQLARAVAERAAATAWDAGAIRRQAQFNAALMQRGEFGREAARRLDEVCDWLLAAAELRRRLRGLGGQWPQSLADLRGQLDSLFAPGFVAAIPEAQWPRIAVYLKAAGIRLDRLANKPARDAELTAQIVRAVQRLPGPFHPARWLIEEWRVALFAQELKALHAPNAQKVEDALRR